MDTAVPGHPRPARISTASLCCRHLPSRSGRPRRYFPLPDHKTSWARRHGGVSPGRGQRWAVPPTRASWRGRLTSCPASRHDPRPRSPAHRRRRARTPGRGPNVSGTSAPLGLAIGKHASRKQRPGPPASALGGGPPFHLRPGQPHPCRVRHGARTGPAENGPTSGTTLARSPRLPASLGQPTRCSPALPANNRSHARTARTWRNRIAQPPAGGSLGGDRSTSGATARVDSPPPPSPLRPRLRLTDQRTAPNWREMQSLRGLPAGTGYGQASYRSGLRPPRHDTCLRLGAREPSDRSLRSRPDS